MLHIGYVKYWQSGMLWNIHIHNIVLQTKHKNKGTFIVASRYTEYNELAVCCSTAIFSESQYIEGSVKYLTP